MPGAQSSFLVDAEVSGLGNQVGGVLFNETVTKEEYFLRMEFVEPALNTLHFTYLWDVDK